MESKDPPARNSSFHFSQVNCISLVSLLWRREYSIPFAKTEVWFYWWPYYGFVGCFGLYIILVLLILYSKTFLRNPICVGDFFSVRYAPLHTLRIRKCYKLVFVLYHNCFKFNEEEVSNPWFWIFLVKHSTKLVTNFQESSQILLQKSLHTSFHHIDFASDSKMEFSNPIVFLFTI